MEQGISHGAPQLPAVSVDAYNCAIRSGERAAEAILEGRASARPHAADA